MNKILVFMIVFLILSDSVGAVSEDLDSRVKTDLSMFLFQVGFGQKVTVLQNIVDYVETQSVSDSVKQDFYNVLKQIYDLKDTATSQELIKFQHLLNSLLTSSLLMSDKIVEIRDEWLPAIVAKQLEKSVTVEQEPAEKEFYERRVRRKYTAKKRPLVPDKRGPKTKFKRELGKRESERLQRAIKRREEARKGWR